jgi:hypothetical protein
MKSALRDRASSASASSSSSIVMGRFFDAPSRVPGPTRDLLFWADGVDLALLRTLEFGAWFTFGVFALLSFVVGALFF